MFQKLFTSILLTLIAIGGFFVSITIENDIGMSDKISIEYSNNVYADANEMETQNDAYMASKSKTDTEVVKLYNSLVALINLLLSAITVIVSPAIMLAGWLMSPDWTSGDLFGLRGVMYKLWITISNITYFIYAILLIFIALATIFGRENYGYKAMLPKLALGILMVPFTWWFVQWTISLSSIVTASVINIPEEALQSIIQGKNGFWNEKIIPEKVIFDENSKEKTVKCSDDKSKCMSPQDMLSKSSGMYGHMLIYAYGIFKLNEVKEIDTVSDALSAVVKIIHDSFIAVIMLVVFGLLTLALIFMLLARAVMLWIYTIFSPFLTLELVMGGLMKKVSDDFSIKEFVGLAFMPAIVGLALSFGLVVVAAVQSPIPKIVTEDTKCTVPKLTGAGCELARIMGNDANKITRKLEKSTDGKYYTTINIVEIGGMALEFKGKPTGYTDVNPETQANDVNSTVNIISSAGGTFGTIVIDIIALLFIWMAFMAAKGVSKVVNAAAQPFEDMGKKIGSLGASLPKYMPLPVPGGSVHGMEKATQLVSNLPQKAAEENFKNSELGRRLGAGDQASTTEMGRVRELYKDSDKAVFRSGSSQNKEAVGNLIRNGGKHDTTGADKEAMEAIAKEFGNNAYKIEQHLIDGGMDKEYAKKIAEEISKGHTDKKVHAELYRLWKSVSEKGSANSANATQVNATYNPTVIAGKGYENKLEIDIEGVRVNIDADGKNLVKLSEENKKKVTEKIKTMTRDEFKNKFKGVSEDVRETLAKEFDNEFRKPTPTPKP